MSLSDGLMVDKVSQDLLARPAGVVLEKGVKSHHEESRTSSTYSGDPSHLPDVLRSVQGGCESAFRASR